MVANRLIKQQYLQSERINALSCPARDLWVRLALSCDEYGLFHARPSLVASACYPLDPNPQVVAELLDELENHRLILRYTDHERPYLIMRQWYTDRIRSEPLFPLPPEDVVSQAELSGVALRGMNTARAGGPDPPRGADAPQLHSRCTAVAQQLHRGPVLPSRARQTPSQAFDFKGVISNLRREKEVGGVGGGEKTLHECTVVQKEPELNKRTVTPAPTSRGPVKVQGSITYDPLTDQFLGITAQHEIQWAEDYPAINVIDQINQARAWLHANPRNMKRNIERFLVNWFSKSQERAPRSVGKWQDR